MSRGSDDAYYYYYTAGAQRPTRSDRYVWDGRDNSINMASNAIQRQSRVPERPRTFINQESNNTSHRTSQQQTTHPTATPYEAHQTNTTRRRSSGGSSASSTNSAALCSPPLRRPVVAMPGTMSSRGENEMHRDQSHVHRNEAPKQIDEKTARRKSTLARCKSAVKDILSSSYVDEEEMVYIEECHWADDS